MNYQTVLNGIKDSYIKILGNNLIGIYIHGSIVFDCFNWEKSDIDFLVVVDKALDIDTKLEIMKSTVKWNKIAPKKGIEMSIVLKEDCLNFKYPTPFELHFSNFHFNWFNNEPLIYCEKMNGTDKDLAAHFTIIKEIGIVLYGEEISNIFGDVAKEFYIDSIKYDIENARNDLMERPDYIVLTLCRVLAFVKDGLILSKKQGGEWGLENLEGCFAELINNALNSYIRNTTMELNDNIDIAKNYCDFMLDKIFGISVSTSK